MKKPDSTHPRPLLSSVTGSAAATRRLASRFAKMHLSAGGCVALCGGLGAGKTVFVQGAASVLGPDFAVTSPTFGLLHEYDSPLPFRHLDLYRIANAEEARASGLDEAVSAEGVCFIEWPERAWEIIPRPFFRVLIEILSENKRRISVTVEE